MGSIFEKMRLSPTQLRTVAERRFADAESLRRTGQNARANGAMYLAGFVVECLLKAKLLEKYSWLQSARNTGALPKADRKLYDLCYRMHDLAAISERLPEVKQHLMNLDRNRGQTGRLYPMLQSVVGRWTIFARYSPQMATMREAADFIRQIKEIKEWLK
jgi:hypothetical protein